MRVLVTGGAGFVGSHLGLAFKESGADVVCFDNLRRRGSELNLRRFAARGVHFVHGDIRSPSDLEALDGAFDVMVEASAEPSVLAGLGSTPTYLLETNLFGTVHCLEFARRRVGAVIFLSTSRVYSIEPLRSLAVNEAATRLELAAGQPHPGASERGIAESFRTDLPRSLYGASKLASELLVQEYAASFGLRAIINRCGVIAGAGQFGKVDQGVFTLWVANHFFGKPLKYTGFGGTGKQVRDLLHPSDLFELIERQLAVIDGHSGQVFNVGGGLAGSTSLSELTATCVAEVGRTVPLASDTTTNAVDIPFYVSDNAKVASAFDWSPKRSVRDIVHDIHSWLQRDEAELRAIFG